MQSGDYEQLFADIKDALASNFDASFALIGHTSLCYDLLAFFGQCQAMHRLLGIYDAAVPVGRPQSGVQLKPLPELRVDAPSVAVITSDTNKEDLLEQVVPHLTPATRIVLAGYGHFEFRDHDFETVVRDSMVPSLANGYPHTLTHLFQCLQNAARLGLNGVVAEFGMFKGGTTMLLSRFIERLGQKWKVIGFDTFAGFPLRRSILDMYDHPGCVFSDEASVRQYLASRNVEIIAGDIVASASRLRHEDVVLAFVDTDNYTSAVAVLDAIQDQVVVGGAIVFDHFTGRNRFLYTLGERIAAKRLLSDRRYFNLHDTGVFIRQR
ncbi:MAG: class I SAM-dependent methyltransferase [Thermoanaerobaculia bacterium]